MNGQTLPKLVVAPNLVCSAVTWMGICVCWETCTSTSWVDSVALPSRWTDIGVTMLQYSSPLVTNYFYYYYYCYYYCCYDYS